MTLFLLRTLDFTFRSVQKDDFQFRIPPQLPFGRKAELAAFDKRLLRPMNRVAYRAFTDAVIKGDTFHHTVFLIILQHDNQLIQNAQFRRPTAPLMFLLIIRL